MNGSIPNLFIDLEIEYIIFVPDSLNSKFIRLLDGNDSIKVMYCATETEAITIGSGISLCGKRAVIVMENSGLRSVADILTRFELSHHIHNIFIISARGKLGEENWWGVMHEKVTASIIRELNMASTYVDDFHELSEAMRNAMNSFKSEQLSVVIQLTKRFYEEIQ